MHLNAYFCAGGTFQTNLTTQFRNDLMRPLIRLSLTLTKLLPSKPRRIFNLLINEFCNGIRIGFGNVGKSETRTKKGNIQDREADYTHVIVLHIEEHIYTETLSFRQIITASLF